MIAGGVDGVDLSINCKILFSKEIPATVGVLANCRTVYDYFIVEVVVGGTPTMV